MFDVCFALDHCYTVPVLNQNIEVLKMQSLESTYVLDSASNEQHKWRLAFAVTFFLLFSLRVLIVLSTTARKGIARGFGWQQELFQKAKRKGSTTSFRRRQQAVPARDQRRDHFSAI
jgi:hypothetical protein